MPDRGALEARANVHSSPVLPVTPAATGIGVREEGTDRASVPGRGL